MWCFFMEIAYYVKRNHPKVPFGINEPLADLLHHQFLHITQGDPFLAHIIPVTDGYRVIFFGLVINGYAKWGTGGIHSPITFADCIFLFIKTHKTTFALVH